MDRRTGTIQQIRRCNHSDGDRCTCDCHQNAFQVYHLIACCHFCPDCERQIKTSRMIAWSPKI